MPIPSPTPFLEKLLNHLEPTPGFLDQLFLDHLCYRVETVDSYVRLRDGLTTENELLVEGLIGGRRISTFKMKTPFLFRGREIPLLELPEPKDGSFYAEGWEHVEFVTDRPLTDFANWLVAELGIVPKAIDRSGMNKARNADLRLRLPDGLSVKFHEQSLEAVIREELAE
ncbi:VOC family protein [Neolewinella agarilytica]|uniref:VOC family protein n=1 Tax=Neolewinella agarilytica TaxID=478744 RepID=UPI00235784FB|nr:VOC family protein [Neolewinella agarilytica]